jgi:hypothetical protein
VPGLPIGRRKTLLARHSGDYPMIDARTTLGHEGERDQQSRRIDERVRPGMNFAERGCAAEMAGTAGNRARYSFWSTLLQIVAYIGIY